MCDSSSSASDLLGVIRVDSGKSSEIRTLTASSCRRLCPEVDTQTGSHTRGNGDDEEKRVLRSAATASTVSALKSMPVLIARTSKSSRTDPICRTQRLLRASIKQTVPYLLRDEFRWTGMHSLDADGVLCRERSDDARPVAPVCGKCLQVRLDACAAA